MKRGVLKPSLLWACLALALIPSVEADGADNEVQRYVEQKDGQRKPVSWQLARGAGYRLVYRNSEETHITETDSDMRTRAWSMSNEPEKVFLQATREKDVIVVRGSRKGQSVEARFVVDQAPWFQATSLSLRKFVLSQEVRITFWTLRSDTLKAMKLTATKVAQETVDAAGTSHAAVKVELRADGWRSAFWKSHYWFRAADGLLLRFEGQAGPSPANRIVIAYAGEQRP